MPIQRKSYVNGIGIVVYGRLGRPTDADWSGVGGIYQRYHADGETFVRKLKYYQPPYAVSHADTPNRRKLRDGVLAWQGLSLTKKERYNKSARGRIMTGFNLFLSKYMLGLSLF